MAKLKTAQIAALLDVAASGASNDEKGRAYERLIDLTFGAVRDIELRATRVQSVFKSEELDAALWVTDCKNMPLRPDIVLVEAKNWSAPVGSKDVGWFLQKLQIRRRDGILLAANGITGDPHDLMGAHDVIQRGLADDIRILVFNQDELRALGTTDDVLAALREKTVDLVMRRTSIVT